MTRRATRRLSWSALAAVALAASCAVNPATGQRELALIGEQQEIALGIENDKAIVQQMGVYPDDALQDYLQRLGQKMAAVSERPDLEWTFRVVDDDVVNAFALPGGFIYITRGIMAHLTSEAQLATVVGHEIGHVTARHSVNQMSKAQLAQLGLGLGSVLAPDLAQQFGGLAQQGLGLLFLKYGRDDERQADSLGLRYMTRADYDPRPGPGVFETLQAVGEASGAERIPAWMSTHPDPGARAERLRAAISEMGGDWSGATVGDEAYLQRLDGMVYGKDPRQGYFEDTLFLHPELKFRIRFPAGWQTVNQRSAVIGVSEQQDAIVRLGLSSAASAAEALSALGGQQGLQVGERWRSDVNGHRAASAYFRATTQQGVLVGLVAYVEYGGNVYELLAYTPESRWSGYRAALEGSIASFDDETSPAVLNVQPARLKIVRASQTMVVEEFARRTGATIPAEELALINQISEGRMRGGQLYKTVVGGRAG